MRTRGELAWQTDTSDTFPVVAGLTEGLVLVNELDGDRVIALDARSGTETWSVVASRVICRTWSTGDHDER